MGKNLEKQHIDRNVAITQISHNSFCAIIQAGSDDDYLMVLIQRIIVNLQVKALLQLGSQVFPVRKAAVNFSNPFGCETFHPTSIIESLCDDLARRTSSLKFD